MNEPAYELVYGLPEDLGFACFCGAQPGQACAELGPQDEGRTRQDLTVLHHDGRVTESPEAFAARVRGA